MPHRIVSKINIDTFSVSWNKSDTFKTPSSSTTASPPELRTITLKLCCFKKKYLLLNAEGVNLECQGQLYCDEPKNALLRLTCHFQCLCIMCHPLRMTEVHGMLVPNQTDLYNAPLWLR